MGKPTRTGCLSPDPTRNVQPPTAGDDGDLVVLDAILQAQENGLFKRRQDGQKRRCCPPFSVACEEIRRGAKKSHWIWYVWPSLRSVRGSMHPEFLLPNFHAACMYLRNGLLSARLVEITRLATEHLKQGIDSAVLFGKMH